MIYGVGIDGVRIERMEKNIARPHFFRRVFSEEEQRRLTALHGKRLAESAAACFAAKEAFLKAAGVGLGGFPLAELAALRHKSGAPYMALSGTAAAFCEQNNLKVHLSLSHEAGLAMAVVVLETQS